MEVKVLTLSKSVSEYFQKFHKANRAHGIPLELLCANSQSLPHGAYPGSRPHIKIDNSSAWAAYAEEEVNQWRQLSSSFWAFMHSCRLSVTAKPQAEGTELPGILIGTSKKDQQIGCCYRGTNCVSDTFPASGQCGCTRPARGIACSSNTV